MKTTIEVPESTIEALADGRTVLVIVVEKLPEVPELHISQTKVTRELLNDGNGPAAAGYLAFKHHDGTRKLRQAQVASAERRPSTVVFKIISGGLA